MAGMVRKQIYIEPRQDALLKQAAKRRSVSEAELIRLALLQVICFHPVGCMYRPEYKQPGKGKQ